ncbi:tetratricopeptide repeat protein [Nocardioides sp.]|uniref:tetratricopeptide repeat protein n=1 Tax=Nocardioides sp. TaxID=35761 RepID=UPI002ED105B9
MSRTTALMVGMDAHEAYRWAADLFRHRDYYTAAEVLQHLVDTHEHDSELGAARELLARAYYHSAQLGRAVDAARDLLDRDPAHGYAALLLTRALERSSRHGEAAAARRYAEALGMVAPGMVA